MMNTLYKILPTVIVAALLGSYLRGLPFDTFLLIAVPSALAWPVLMKLYDRAMK